jgi:hypothetical protein
MSIDPYVTKVLDSEFPFKTKKPVVGQLVCILHTHSKNRHLELAVHPSRAVVKHEIHEVILTTEADAGVGKIVDEVAHLAYFEVLEGGVVLTGDMVAVDGQEIGRLVGFDYTHCPNHMNLCIRVPEPLRSGYEMGFNVGAQITFTLIQPEST